MRPSSRFGAVAAVAALSAATVVAGSGVAHAQERITFSSPSALSVAFQDDEIVVEYNNRSGHALGCVITVSTAPVINTIHNHLTTADDTSEAITDSGTWPEEVWNTINASVSAQEFAVGEIPDIPVGHSGFVPAVPVSEEFIHTNFAIEGLSICFNPDGSYAEIERTSGGLFGSVGDPLGSVGSLFGS